MDVETRHATGSSQYELVVDDRVRGVAEYIPAGERVVFNHTVIDPELRGQGLGKVLVRAALDDVRERGQLVVARCWFVAEFLDHHPEYQDLRAA